MLAVFLHKLPLIDHKLSFNYQFFWAALRAKDCCLAG